MTGVRQSAPLSEPVLAVASDAVVVFGVLSGELVWGNRSFAMADGQPGDPFSHLVRFADLCAAAHWDNRRPLDRILSRLTSRRGNWAAERWNGWCAACSKRPQCHRTLLCPEATESVLVNADSPELAELHRLRALGCKIALDDFGTGYSPLTYLKRLPATTLKLDRSFVKGLDKPKPDSVDLAIARSALRLGVEIGLTVIAEGVESQRQFEVLVGLGYELFQGYWPYFPMPSGELAALLDRTAGSGG